MRMMTGLMTISTTEMLMAVSNGNKQTSEKKKKLELAACVIGHTVHNSKPHYRMATFGKVS